MNKNLLKLTLLVSILCVFCVLSCAKRDKLTNNSMLVTIEPNKTVTLLVGNATTLSAVVRNAKNEIVEPESINWSVSPSNLGTFDNTSSISTTFYATSSGTGKIILTCEGIQGSVDLKIN